MSTTAETSATTPTAVRADEPTERLRALRDQLGRGLVERDDAVRLALLAALAGEHLLLVGPPGTAKSLVARRLQRAFKDGMCFERLLTRFSVPEEIFGPLSIKALENDRYERVTAGYLPTATVAFLDEIFKANSAILNALLTILNEREFDNGTRREKTPLVAVIGASNELTEGAELDALFDRFLLRLHVGPVSREGFAELLGLRGDDAPEVPDALRLTADDLRSIREHAARVEVPADVIAMLGELRQWCAAQEIAVSDRRWRKVVKLLQVSAFTNGRAAVSVWDCWLLQHCLWEEPGEWESVRAWYESRVGASAAMDPSRLTSVIALWEAKLKCDKESQSQMRDARGNLLYVGCDGGPTAEKIVAAPARRGSEALYLSPANASAGDYYDNEYLQDRTNAGKGYTRQELDPLRIPEGRFMHWPRRDAYLADPSNRLTERVEAKPAMEPSRHKRVYRDDCIRQVDQFSSELSTYQSTLGEHMRGLAAHISSHLWVSDDFVGPATRSLEATTREVQTLLQRVKVLRQGFEMLPVEDDGEVGPANRTARKSGPSTGRGK